MKCILIDDERLARTELRRLLADHPGIEIVAEAKNGEEALQLIDQHHPDLLFLDIQMPGMTGFELLENVDRTPFVIFTTAYDDFALKAFEVNALDYLMKPIVPERLAAALARVHKQAADAGQAPKPAAVLEPNQQIFVKEGERCWFVPVRDIYLLESEGNYTRVFFGNNRPLLLRSLNYLEERLDPAMFFRASRKHIINLRSVDAIEPWVNNGFVVKLKNGSQVEMSRRQAQRFKELMTI